MPHLPTRKMKWDFFVNAGEFDEKVSAFLKSLSLGSVAMKLVCDSVKFYYSFCNIYEIDYFLSSIGAITKIYVYR